MKRLRGIVSTVLAGLMLAGGGLVLAGNEPRKLSRVVVCDDNRDPVTLDPFYELSEKKHTLIQQIMEGLVRFDANAQVIPVLAERWEQVDPRHLRFFLRKNVKFHNGEPFDAESVRFTLQRFIDPATHSPVSGL
ncbi:MAG TPA: ABC transporter substrate-binding protein, partial [Elusimicrobiota bacterium]|nr:ABC transporter substrate-binding protein [Elusimicrobiota bacterium]